MRLLFVSSTTVGGSGRSQRELAARLVEAGHEVTFLVDDEAPDRLRRWGYEQLSDLAVRVGNRPGGRLVRALERLPGRRTGRLELDGFVHATTPVPQNALERVLDEFRPDVVVGNSLVRLSWRRIRATCERRGIPTVLYVREITSLDHLLADEMPDAVVANARSLVSALEERGVFLLLRAVRHRPDPHADRLEPRGRARGEPHCVARHRSCLRCRRRLRDLPFVLQESWPLDSHDLRRILASRRLSFPTSSSVVRMPPGPQLYGDARVLLVPHRIDNRPRVIAEAQANGIPVIAFSNRRTRRGRWRWRSGGGPRRRRWLVRTHPCAVDRRRLVRGPGTEGTRPQPEI